MGIIAEGSREAFRLIIDALKDIAGKQGVVITDEEIAGKLDISITKFKTFYDNDWAPDELFSLLRQKYDNYIATLSYRHIWVLDEKEVDDPDPDSPNDDDE